MEAARMRGKAYSGCMVAMIQHGQDAHITQEEEEKEQEKEEGGGGGGGGGRENVNEQDARY
eukprot:1137014-Pelagomonas_calceolata.AAC.1